MYHEKHRIDISVNRPDHACLNEHIPIVLTVKSDDARSMDLLLDILLAPRDDAAGGSEAHAMTSLLKIASGDQLFDDGQSSGNLIKHASLGRLEPGQTSTKKINLLCYMSEGERVLDVSVQSVTITVTGDRDEQETLRTVHVSVYHPFKLSAHPVYTTRRRDAWSLEEQPPIPDGHHDARVFLTLEGTAAAMVISGIVVRSNVRQIEHQVRWKSITPSTERSENQCRK